MYIQANIGRNVAERDGSTRAMNDTAWLNFQNDVKEEVMMSLLAAGLGGLVSLSSFQVHTGTGEWNGVKEESAHVSVYFDHDGRTYDGTMGSWLDRRPDVRKALEVKLAYLAFQYGQDAIAFMVTDSHLATR
jgi:hypothetical protein